MMNITRDLMQDRLASIGFVKNGVSDTIAEGVPAEQIVLGMPFYTRVWALTPKDTAGDSVEAASDDYVSYDTTSQALGMDDVQNFSQRTERLQAGRMRMVRTTRSM